MGYITGLGGSGYNSYFTDSGGVPRLLVLEQAWMLPTNAGRWNGLSAPSNWQTDFDAYTANRSSQGHNAWYGTVWNNIHTDSGALSGGRTWDGIYPLIVNGTAGAIATGTETISLNSTFWQRIDYFFNSAKAQNMTCFLNVSESYDISQAGSIWQHATNTQGTAFGNALATRYPVSSWPNVQWFFGDDDDGPNDSFYQAILNGMVAAGDTRALISDEQFGSTNCHIEFDNKTAFGGAFGVPNATYNWVYCYSPPYNGVEASYTEGGSFAHIPPIWGDGPYYGDSGVGSNADNVIRSFTWWALASGARGFNNTGGPSDLAGTGVWRWQSGAAAALTTDPNGTWITGHTGLVASYFTGLTDWHKLIPDTGSVFVTAGRGTKTTPGPPGENPNYAPSDTYVAASITPGGTLAVIYCRSHFSITIDQTKLASHYTATWVDPASLATTATATGSTYSSTGLGNNSAGDPDWVLVLQAPQAAATPPVPPTISRGGTPRIVETYRASR